MLLDFLTNVNRDPKLEMVDTFFSAIKRFAIFFNTSSHITNEIKLIQLIEQLIKKFIRDKYQFKIDRVTMKIVAEINEILEKHSEKHSCKKHNEEDDDDELVDDS
jgi:hypothetical protein